MKKRIFRSILSACLVVLSAVVLTTVYSVYRAFLDEEVSRLQVEAASMAKVLNDSGKGAEARLIEEDIQILSPTDIRVCLIEPDGSVYFDSLYPSRHANHADRQEIVEAHEDGVGFSVRYSDTLSTETYNVAVLLKNGSVLRLSRTHASLLSLFVRMIAPIAILVPILIGASWVMAGLLSRHIVTPINAIDPANPLENIPYEQLRPLLERLDENNKQIQSQMEQLELRNREFDALSASMEEGLVMVWNTGKPSFVNRAARSIFDLEQKFSLHDNEQLGELLEQALGGASLETTRTVRGKTYSLLAQPIWKDKEILGAMVLAQDVTEKLEAKRRRQEFTANVTHELKTPLHTISSSAELLSSGLVKADDIPRFTGYISKEAARMSAMVSDIIHLSRLENEEQPQSQAVDVYEIARTEIEKMAQSAEVAGIELSLEGSKAIVLANPVDIQSVLKNLIENAIRYNTAPGYVHVSVHQHNDKVRLMVEDDGVGIAPELQERIFERFFTADVSRTHCGTGLGLAIVRHAIDNLGGSIHLDSEPGKGTCFEIELDAHDEQAANKSL